MVALDSDFVLSATIHPAVGASDAQPLASSLRDAAVYPSRAGCEEPILSVTADKAYPSQESLAACDELGLKTYVPEKKAAKKPAAEAARTAASEDRAAAPAVDSAPPPGAAAAGKTKPPSRRELLRQENKVRSESAEGRRLLKLRSEKVERSFAHVCGTGGARRPRLRSWKKISKCRLATVAARNLGLLMRMLFGIGTPRGLQGTRSAVRRAFARLSAAFGLICAWFAAPSSRSMLPTLRFGARSPLAG